MRPHLFSRVSTGALVACKAAMHSARLVWFGIPHPPACTQAAAVNTHLAALRVHAFLRTQRQRVSSVACNSSCTAGCELQLRALPCGPAGPCSNGSAAVRHVSICHSVGAWLCQSSSPRNPALPCLQAVCKPPGMAAARHVSAATSQHTSMAGSTATNSRWLTREAPLARQGQEGRHTPSGPARRAVLLQRGG